MRDGSGFGVFRNYQDYLDALTDGMSRVRRWGLYHGRGVTFETVCEHTMQQVMICRDLFDLQRARGEHEGIDEVLLLRAALIHDQGEGVQGTDIPWTLKQDPVLGPRLEELEREAVETKIISPMPEAIADHLAQDFAVQHDLESSTGRLFRASEVVGYMIRAMQQYRSGVRELGVHVFVHQYENLRKWAEEFVSVRVVFEQFRGEVEHALLHDTACVQYATEKGTFDAIRARIGVRAHVNHESANDAVSYMRPLPHGELGF